MYEGLKSKKCFYCNIERGSYVSFVSDKNRRAYPVCIICDADEMKKEWMVIKEK